MELKTLYIYNFIVNSKVRIKFYTPPNFFFHLMKFDQTILSEIHNHKNVWIWSDLCCNVSCSENLFGGSIDITTIPAVDLNSYLQISMPRQLPKMSLNNQKLWQSNKPVNIIKTLWQILKMLSFEGSEKQCRYCEGQNFNHPAKCSMQNWNLILEDHLSQPSITQL